MLVYIVFTKQVAVCTHTHEKTYVHVCERERVKRRMREKTFVQYLFTATSISKYRKRSKQASRQISENKNRSRRRQCFLFDKQTLYIHRFDY